METCKKNVQIRGTTIQYFSQIDFGDRSLPYHPQVNYFYKLPDRLQYENTPQISPKIQV